MALPSYFSCFLRKFRFINESNFTGVKFGEKSNYCEGDEENILDGWLVNYVMDEGNAQNKCTIKGKMKSHDGTTRVI